MDVDEVVFWSESNKKRDHHESSLFGHGALFGLTYGAYCLQNKTLSSLIPSL